MAVAYYERGVRSLERLLELDDVPEHIKYCIRNQVGA
jgi:hypothetical protein